MRMVDKHVATLRHMSTAATHQYCLIKHKQHDSQKCVTVWHHPCWALSSMGCGLGPNWPANQQESHRLHCAANEYGGTATSRRRSNWLHCAAEEWGSTTMQQTACLQVMLSIIC